MQLSILAFNAPDLLGDSYGPLKILWTIEIARIASHNSMEVASVPTQRYNHSLARHMKAQTSF